MILRNGTVLSNMASSKTSSSRTSSSDEVNNEGERPPMAAQSLEPVLTPLPTTRWAEATQAPSSVSGNEYNAHVWDATWFCTTYSYTSSNTTKIKGDYNNFSKSVVHKHYYSQFTSFRVIPGAFNRPKYRKLDSGPHVPKYD